MILKLFMNILNFAINYFTDRLELDYFSYKRIIVINKYFLIIG